MTMKGQGTTMSPHQPASESATTQAPEAMILCEEVATFHALTEVCEACALTPKPFEDGEALLAGRMFVAHPGIIVLEAGDVFADTFRLYSQLRQTAALLQTPVLFIISHTQVDEALERCNLQNNDYLVKPFGKQALSEKIKLLLGTHQTEGKDNKRKRFETGEVLSRRYEIKGFLGEGGMGQVYHVLDLQKEQGLALKMLFNDNAEDEEAEKAVRRFGKEIEALLVLNHPNIIKIHDYGQHLKYSFYTMDYLPHGCLADILQKERTLPPLKALQLLIPLASALQHAHSNNLLHRDLKPANIMFKKGGAPVLTDFGLALQIANAQTRLTKKGHIIGTAQYMSPEQILTPNELDGRADLYALGIMFYEMLTGRTPFVSKNYIEILRQALTQPIPDPRTFQSNLPEPVAQFCLKALARNKEDRFATAAEMVAAAAQLLAIR